ncbi:hypothetical protein LTR10_019311 [Elasticomyces elasticus]|uniref:Major facilitator superfamily (MFS) profile domain-containing protein n=1 Tax=Exophiala sideris TaxID=1016849 RepID=A0ABR0J128_9EURO|nr:hypothetical protein LTR10_019311 [Elasticomyces elasticus]KAK5024312.1 hypothetical protein LTS07_008603 [Exophiala sideris]KAK5031006.1 hypothetical protein LTR13_008019 [Exophiala sideris]KAK5054045.1 hypothetical protein LTR69_009007 [Exophiala sideris]KAK5179599.1 hypothetical protein LTR44_008115 [Eurotiomycetes sp. CCFEE 6388]
MPSPITEYRDTSTKERNDTSEQVVYQLPEITEGTIESQQVDAIAEQRVLRKVDRHIVPLVMVLYLLSFMDRVNIGNARLYGLEEDLGLTANQFQVCVSILFVTYVLCELPSNLALKGMKPSRWISFLAMSWGIIAMCTGSCQSFGAMSGCRLLFTSGIGDWCSCIGAGFKSSGFPQR